MKHIIKYLFICFGIITLFLPLTSYSHIIPYCYDCDGINKPVIEEIPCIMKDKLDWDIASEFMRDWFSGKYSTKSREIEIEVARDLHPKLIEKKEAEIKTKKFLFEKNKEGDMPVDFLIRTMSRDGSLTKTGNFDYTDDAVSEFNYEKTQSWKPKYDKECHENCPIPENDENCNDICVQCHNDCDDEYYMHYIGEKIVKDYNVSHEFAGAFGNIVLRLNVKGEVVSYDGVSKVTLTGGSIYLRDNYDFVDEEEGKISQPLGFWSKWWPYVSPAAIWGDTLTLYVNNKSFRNLGEGDNTHHDYRIFTDPGKNTFKYPENDRPVFYVKNDSIIESPNEENIMEQAFDRAYNQEGGKGVLGSMTDEGTHCWSDSSNNSNCTNGVWIRDYRKGSTETALIYNPDQNEAWLMSEVFWAYYKMIGGNRVLGAPKNDATRKSDGSYRQDFQFGTLIWSSSPQEEGYYSYSAWGITEYDKDGDIVCRDGNCTPGSDNGGADSGFICENVNGFQTKIGSWGNQCVQYVRKESDIEYACCNGYAKNCYSQANDCGYNVGSSPELNSIAVFDSWKGNPYGHVGIVIGIDSKNHKIKLRHSNWHLNELVSEEWVSTKKYPVKGYIYCDGDSLGSGGSTLPSDSPDYGLPDFITDKVTIANKDGRHEKYIWKINETAYVHSWTDNIGDADWEGSAERIKVPFYLSSGTKEDRHSEWIRVGREKIKKQNLKIKQKPKHEYIKFDLKDWANDSKILPGKTYNFVVCADRPKDEDNGDGDVKEKHKSNNCSSEAVFYVDYGPPRDVDLITRQLALTKGRTSLQAGEHYGLEVEISNIGTEPPWNGFRSSYEIKGPGTGNQWQFVADDGSDADQLYPGATQSEYITDGHGAKAPMVGGDYLFRACADYHQVVPETDESNNCTELAVYIAPPPLPDLITHSLRLTDGRSELYGGELYGLEVGIQNVGEAAPDSDFRTSYEIKGPGTGGVWQFVADDGSDADSLAPGVTHWEHITDNHGAHIPNVAGTYTARACADYRHKVAEENEENNCSETTFEVIIPECVILNPMERLPATGGFDMAATSIDFPGTITRGEEMHPRAVNCTASGSSPDTRAMWAYARCDGTGFTELDGDSDDGMGAGECTTEEIITHEYSAGMEPGVYVMYFISNGVSRVPESDYSNNVQAKTFIVK